MILNHTEKEFISAITTYEGKAKSGSADFPGWQAFF